MNLSEKNAADSTVSGWVKVVCPHCGYEMPIFCGKNAKSEDLHVRCKARHCKKFFEIVIAIGK